MAGSSAAGGGGPTISTLYLAPADDLENSNTKSAITLDPSIGVSTNTSYSGNFSEFDCVILDAGYSGIPAIKNDLITYVKNGGGLLLVSSPELTANASLLVDLGILITGAVVHENPRTRLATIDQPSGSEGHPLSRKVEWNSMPELADYTNISKSNTDSTGNINVTGTTILLDRYVFIDEGAVSDDPLLIDKVLGSGHVLFHVGYLGNPKASNYQVKVWPYFNYMFYVSIQYLANPTSEIVSYGTWAYSPVPHRNEQVIIGVYVCAMLVLAVTLFFIVKRASKRSRLDQASLDAAKVETVKKEETIELGEEKRKFIADLMASGKDPEEIEAEIAKIANVDLTDKWEQVGSHKQISGFLFGFFMGIIVLIPQIVVTAILLPQYILPFPQVNGWMDLTRNFFSAIWTAFDVGTSIALAKYFSQYRITQPDKAIHYAQIFVWWQMMSGVLQIFVVAFIGSILFPQTYMAHLSWMFIMHSLIQYPGFFLVFQYIFQGMQRTDYQLLTQLLYTIVFNILCQIGAIMLFRYIFASVPVFGEAMGAGIGFAFGQYFAEWGSFFFTVWLFKKMKFSLRTVFRIDFTWAEFKEALTYGAKFMLGSVWVPAVWLFQVFLQSIYVKGYAAENGYFNLIYTFGSMVAVVGLFMEGLLAGVSESHSHKKMSLLKLHTVQGTKWSNFMTFFIIALLAMVGARLVEGFAGSTWLPAIKYLPLVLIFHFNGPFSWQGDKMLSGTNNNGYAALAWVIEQSVRATLLFLLIPKFQMMGVLLAYIPALVTKNTFMWIVIRKKVVAPKIYFNVVWISPAISAIIVALVVKLFDSLLWTAPVLEAISPIGATAILFLGALFGGLYLYVFISGVLGHWDKNTLQELDKAAKMVKVVGFLARGMYKAARAGYKVSPFKERWPVDIFTDGMREAHELEIEKKVLKI
jgi:O-antigen/teichoic acid export membrane protein